MNRPPQAEYTIRQGGTLLSLFPQMHLRGKAFKYELVTPDSQVTPLLDIPRYDFSWQSYYDFKTPLVVPPGSKIRATAWFDNSSANPWNPDPTKAGEVGGANVRGDDDRLLRLPPEPDAAGRDSGTRHGEETGGRRGRRGTGKAARPPIVARAGRDGGECKARPW